MSLTLVTPPAVEPLTLDEAKQYLRVDVNTDDALIGALISSATDHIDGHSGVLGRALISQTWRLDLARFRDEVKFPLPPLQSVASVKYYDTAGVLQTVASTVYEVIAGGTSGGRLCRLGDQSWPTDVNAYMAEPVQITFVAGYGDSWNDIPEGIRLGIAYMVNHHFDIRSPVNIGNIVTEIPETSNALIAPYRMVGLA